MGVIGNLTVGVTANTEKFSRNMKGARGELGLFGKAAENITHQLTHLATGFAAGLTIHKFISDIERATETLVELGHAAKRLGATTEGFGGLEHAGALVHVSNEELIRDLTFMEKNLGKNADAFDKLGLSVTELKQLHADEAFLKIAKAIERLPNAAEKTAATLAIFGKGGASILNLTGSDLDSAMAEAKRMGLAPSEEDIKKIEEEDRAIQRLKESWRGLANAAAVYFSGFAQHAAELSTMLLGGDTPGQQHAQRLIDSMSKEDFDANKRKMQWSGANLPGTAGGYQFEAIKRREAREAQQAEDARKGGAWNAITSFLGGAAGSVYGAGANFASGAGGFLASTGLLGSDFLNRTTGHKGMLADQIAELSPADMDRISSSIDEMPRPWLTKKSSPFHPDNQVMGNAALEKGTAAAFSASARAKQSSELVNINKEQLKTQNKMDRSLQNIDKNIKATTTPVTVNIA